MLHALAVLVAAAGVAIASIGATDIDIGESFPLFDHERLLFFGPKNNKN